MPSPRPPVLHTFEKCPCPCPVGLGWAEGGPQLRAAHSPLGKTKIIDFNRNTTQKSSNKHFCLTIFVQKSNFSAFGESKIPEAALYFPRVCSNLSHNICKLNAEHSIPWHKLRSLMCYWLQPNQTVFLYYNRHYIPFNFTLQSK